MYCIRCGHLVEPPSSYSEDGELSFPWCDCCVDFVEGVPEPVIRQKYRRLDGIFRISCPRLIVEGFKRVAADRHPKEAYAVLLGRITARNADVRDVWYPETQDERAGSGEVPTIWNLPAWGMKARDIAESEGLRVVGDIHSHPESDPTYLDDPSPSYWDWRNHLGPRWIRAICVVVKRPRSLRFRVTWWPPLAPVRATLI